MRLLCIGRRRHLSRRRRGHRQGSRADDLAETASDGVARRRARGPAHLRQYHEVHQVLVIFVIRTCHSPWRSWPNPWLAIISIIEVVVAVLLPLTPIAGYLGFVAPPSLFFASLVVRHFVISVQRNGLFGFSFFSFCFVLSVLSCG